MLMEMLHTIISPPSCIHPYEKNRREAPPARSEVVTWKKGKNHKCRVVFNEAQVKLFTTKLEVGTSRRRPDCKCTYNLPHLLH